MIGLGAQNLVPKFAALARTYSDPTQRGISPRLSPILVKLANVNSTKQTTMAARCSHFRENVRCWVLMKYSPSRAPAYVRCTIRPWQSEITQVQRTFHRKLTMITFAAGCLCSYFDAHSSVSTMLTTPLAISDNASTTYFTHRKLTNKWILAPPLTPHARDYRLGYEPYVPIMNRQATCHASKPRRQQ